jgi:hypothetical protein
VDWTHARPRQWATRPLRCRGKGRRGKASAAQVAHIRARFEVRCLWHSSWSPSRRQHLPTDMPNRASIGRSWATSRQVMEETGYDLEGLLNSDDFIELVLEGKRCAIWIAQIIDLSFCRCVGCRGSCRGCQDCYVE